MNSKEKIKTSFEHLKGGAWADLAETTTAWRAELAAARAAQLILPVVINNTPEIFVEPL